MFPPREELLRGQNRNLACGIIGRIARKDGGDSAFSLGGEMLNRVLEILEARRKGSFNLASRASASAWPFNFRRR